MAGGRCARFAAGGRAVGLRCCAERSSGGGRSGWMAGAGNQDHILDVGHAAAAVQPPNRGSCGAALSHGCRQHRGPVRRLAALPLNRVPWLAFFPGPAVACVLCRRLKLPTAAGRSGVSGLVTERLYYLRVRGAPQGGACLLLHPPAPDSHRCNRRRRPVVQLLSCAMPGRLDQTLRCCSCWCAAVKTVHHMLPSNSRRILSTVIPRLNFL